MFNLFGALPDILMGRDPKDALLGNALAVSAALAAPQILPGMMGSGASPGLLGAETAADTGLNAAGYLAPEMGTAAQSSPGLLGQMTGAMDTAGKFVKPIGAAMNVAQQMGGNEPQMQAPPPPQIQTQRMDLSGLLGYGQQQRQFDDMEAERRKQLMAMYANRIGGMG